MRIGRRCRRVALAVVASSLAAGCGSSGGDTTATTADPGRPVVLVTYSVLGDVVRQLVGEAATVEVIIPNGQDPHEYAASAHDVEQMGSAALVVANGLDLEEGLVEPLEQVEDDGVPVFRAADHVTVRDLGADEDAHDEDAHDDDAGDEHAHEGADPHLWTDPLTMAEMAPALGEQLSASLGVDMNARVAIFQREMAALDREVREIVAAVPAGECILVTGHDSLGYFAQRYGCTVVGAIVPSLSSTAEASAKDLAELLDTIDEIGVGAIFTEVGTPAQVAEQIADEAGVPLVELPSHTLPDAGGYHAFIVDVATKIADGLT
jgi:zinc/manganese transport system substrate-binding protein